MSTVHPLAVRARGFHTRLRQDLHRQQQRWHYHVDRRRVRFDERTRRAHQRLKQRVLPFLRHSSLLNLLTTPLIYSLGLPLVLLDVWVTLYQWCCFPIYGIALVRRRAYFVVDRHELAYLNAIERLHCFYCSYATGLFAYVREVAARTEQYWCPIKHSRPVAEPHRHYQSFVEFGDAGGYHRRLPALRQSLRRAA